MLQQRLVQFYSLQVFQTSISWWSFTGVCVVASLIRSPWTILRIQNRTLVMLMVWNGQDSSSDFNFFQSLFQAFWDCSKSTNYNWYHRHSHVPKFSFLVLRQGAIICLSFAVRWNSKIYKMISSFFVVN